MSVQERAQLKRPPLDPWSTRELLWLVSAVTRNGDQNWVSVARSLKPLVAENTRPADWFSQKSCAAQYGALLERAEAPRRKKRISDGSSSTPPPSSSSETPQQIILKRLTQDRIQELQKLMAEEVQSFTKLKEELKELHSSNCSESRIRGMAITLEAEQRLKQCELAKHAQWLRERAERKTEQGWRKPESDAPHSSPLLTSLLQSPTPITQIPSTESTSESASTIPLSIINPTDLPVAAEDSQTVNKVPDDQQRIEQIKSELQKIEHLFTNPGADSDTMINVLNPLHSVSNAELPIMKETPVSETAKTPEKIEIDDIEIKAEDVYAFSDIDLDIPPVSSIHKTSLGRTPHLDKNLFNKRELSTNMVNVDKGQLSEQENSQGLTETAPPHDVNVIQTEPKESESCSSKTSNDTTSNLEDTTQNQTVVEDIKVSEESTATDNKLDVTETISEKDDKTNIVVNAVEEEDSDREMNQSVSELKKDLEAKKNHDSVTINTEVDKSETKDPSKEENVDAVKKIENISIKEEDPVSITEDQNTISADSRSEIYDDAPMEVIKEDKPGKKRDYSRKKPEKEDRQTPIKDIDSIVIKSEFTDDIGSDNSQESSDKKLLSKKLRNELSGSRSESPATPIDSLPNSPAPATPPPHSTERSSQATSEQDRDYKTWKKSVTLALNELCALKYASLFLRPITDEHAPGYSQAIKKPMDFSTIRRNIDFGVIRTTREFQRDVMLMLTNALMYNRTDHRVYTMAYETIQEAIVKIGILVQAQAHAAAQSPALSRVTRPSRPASRQAGTSIKRKRGGGNETPTMKKRRIDEN